jgi:hypothetical protein
MNFMILLQFENVTQYTKSHNWYLTWYYYDEMYGVLKYIVYD